MGNEATMRAVAEAETAYANHKRKKPLFTMSGPGAELTKLLLDAAGLSGQRVKRLTVTLDQTITFEAEYMGAEEPAQAALDRHAEAVKQGA
jgi:hypothetical protein